jgi:hypothetical protein
MTPLFFIIMGVMVLFLSKKNKENDILLENSKALLNSSVSEVMKRVESENAQKDLEKKVNELKEALMDIEIEDIISEQMDMISGILKTPPKVIKKNMDKIIDMVNILESKKMGIAQELNGINIQTPKPLIIDDINKVLAVTPEEFLNVYASYSYSNVLSLMGVEESDQAREKREARMFFGDIIKNHKLFKNKNFIILNKNKH